MGDGIENYVACAPAFLITEYEGEEIYITIHPTGDARDNISIFISSDGGESWNEHVVYTEGNICVGYTEMCIAKKMW